MATTTKLTIQQGVNLLTNPVTVSKYPKFVVNLGSSIAGVTVDELTQVADLINNSTIAAQTAAANAKTSETNAKASETKAKTSENNAKTSENNAKTSETNAKTSENNINTVLQGYVPITRKINNKTLGSDINLSGIDVNALPVRGNLAAATDINTFGPTDEFTGIWGITSTATAASPNLPENSTGILIVLSGGRFGCTQIFLGAFGTMYLRTLLSSWNASSPNWGSWLLVGDQPVQSYTTGDLNLVTTPGLYSVTSTATNFPPVLSAAVTGIMRVEVRLNSTQIVQTYKITSTASTYTDRVFRRSLSAGIWSTWVEEAIVGDSTSPNLIRNAAFLSGGYLPTFSSGTSATVEYVNNSDSRITVIAPSARVGVLTKTATGSLHALYFPSFVESVSNFHSVKPGDVIDYSLMVWATGITNTTQLRLVISTFNGNTLIANNRVSIYDPSITGWQQLAGTIVIPANCTQITIGLWSETTAPANSVAFFAEPSLTKRLPVYAITLDSRTNLNSLTTPGKYYGNYTNGPLGTGYGILTVENNGTFITQSVQSITNGVVYSRSYNTSWSNWGQSFSSNDVIGIANGGTGANTASGAISSLGIDTFVKGFGLGVNSTTSPNYIYYPATISNTSDTRFINALISDSQDTTHQPVSGEEFGGLSIVRSLRPAQFGVSGRGNGASFWFRGYNSPTSNLSEWIQAAKAGANSDITSLTGLTTALGVAYGGTGANNAASARSNLGFTDLGITGIGTILSSLDWQTFDFVPTAKYYVNYANMTNVPAGLVFTSNLNAIIHVSGWEGISVRHITVTSSTTTATGYIKYEVRLVGAAGSRTSTVRQIYSSADIVAITNGGTGANTAAAARTNLGLGENDTVNFGITTLGNLASVNNNILRLVTSNYGVIHRINGSDYYILTTDNGSPTGNYNSFRPIQIKLDTGAVIINSLTLTNDLDIANGGTGASSAADARTNLDVFSKSEVGLEFINGLDLSVSGSVITCSAGSAYIQGYGIVRVTSPLSVTVTGLTANTWRHVYLYMNGSNPAIEAVTTEPTDYAYPAKQKTGASNRRYLGSFRVAAGPTILAQVCINGRCMYKANWSGNNRALANGTATSTASISIASWVPSTAQTCEIAVTNTSTAAATPVEVSSTSEALGSVSIQPGGKMVYNLPLEAYPNLYYRFTPNPSSGGGVFIDVGGYTYGR